MKPEVLQPLLRTELEYLVRAAASLEKSAAKCAKVEPSPRRTFEEEESFDALTSKFARSSDILTQKVLKTLVLLLREDAPTFIDRMNLCERLGVIPSAKALIGVRDLRNMIAHEYAAEDLMQVYADTLEAVPVLLSAITSARAFIGERFPG
ncbi:MAG: hypothetical protein ACKOD5_10710 [Chthoniobacterales bacterium]